MTDQPPYPIRTERLLLREFRETDLDDIHAYGSDEATVRYMEWGPNTPEITRKFLDERLAEQAVWPRAHLSFAVELLEEGKVIGATHIALEDHGNAMIGYTFGSPYWRRGIGYEAAFAMVSKIFDELGGRRVWASCDARNQGSFAIMEKLGMRREGTLRQHMPARGGGWRDTHVYAVLSDEWASRAGAS
jgi:RimJ/RimL family protein N-acetyltransferase